MYKSREDEHQRRYAAKDTQESFNYDHKHQSNQNDVYDEDDFYGQIMKNASKSNPCRTVRSEPVQDYDNAYEPRRSRMEDPTFSRSSFTPREERPTNPYQKPENAYSNSVFDNSKYSAQMNYKQPVHAYERTTQFTNTQLSSNTESYRNAPLPDTPLKRTHAIEEPYTARAPQAHPYSQDENIALRKRTRSVENPQTVPYKESNKEQMQEPKKTLRASMTLSEEVEAQRKPRRVAQKKKNTKQATKRQTKATISASDFKSFVKQNLLLFVYALINCIALSLIASSLAYMQLFQNSVISYKVQLEILRLCLIISPIFAYSITGFHCGYFMFKNKIKRMKIAFKIILSPILFIIFEAVGIICEIPYLIYATIKMGDK